MRDACLQTEWFRAFVGGLASAGVTDVVLSPGSRSTPLVAAAHADPRLHLTALYDERSSGFFSLGMSRASGRPVAVLRTSGSAGGHDLPAIMEARAARLPLIVITADRPPELHSAGASQTTDQVGMFGGRPSASFDLGAPCVHGLEAVGRKAVQVVRAACAPVPGPVHVNAPARKPLEPALPRDETEQTWSKLVDAKIRAPLTTVEGRSRLGPTALAMVADRLRTSGPGLVIAGPHRGPGQGKGRTEAVHAFLDASGYVLAAETASGLRCMHPQAFAVPDWSLRDFTPSVVISMGAQPSSRTLQAVLRRSAFTIHVDPYDLVDPDVTTDVAFFAEPDDFFERAAEVARCETPTSWIAFDRSVMETIGARLSSEPAFDEAGLVRRFMEQLPDGAVLVLGNSLSIRLVDRFGLPRAGPVFSQRGLSGIDGLVSGAAGTAMEQPGPTAVLLGDLSFLHDLSGLWAARQVRRPLMFLVVDNRGGRIFDELPIATSHPGLMSMFTTPVEADFSALARGFGVPSATVERLDQLAPAMASAWSRPGPTVVWARVAPGRLTQRTQAIQDGLESGPR
ncbi:MAG: 2-succinyl-5-enolpyruvyl-6-hydroxy-3-cyclohexene-1-carboxylic-acid synthase [Myxococcota bacterium]